MGGEGLFKEGDYFKSFHQGKVIISREVVNREMPIIRGYTVLCFH